ncbi:MAG: glycosyltransferase family 2 protein [Phycisphaeraceae bacterium]|nr:glycosyltransferase family 2 protein [Phycisphaeraceae bacterium]
MTTTPTAPSSVATARVVALIVTWNRREHVQNVLSALARQRAAAGGGAGACALHAVVIDNAATDGTASALARSWRPDRVVINDTDRAHVPKFREGSVAEAANEDGSAAPGATVNPLRSALASLTVVRNRCNLGGCGGFNTGFAYVAHAFDGSTLQPPDYVWLVDDDADLPEDALGHLMSAMTSDASIGLVGSRTVNISDRSTTIETTIYFDRTLGRMCPEPPAGHPREQSHRAWLASPGGAGGQRVGGGHYSGVLDVEVVSACSMLARWADVVGTDGRSGVGFWDRRYFIYCDDADWCLRFGMAGKRVVLCLDAVVYHTPWLMKLTPQRLYYAQRNACWMTRKLYRGRELKRITRLWMRSLMRDALSALTHRRLTHSAVILQTIDDIVGENWGIDGKTAPEAPPAATADEVRALIESARRMSRPVLLVIHNAEALNVAREWLARVGLGSSTGMHGEIGDDRPAVSSAEPAPSPPPLLLYASNTVPGFEHTPPGGDALSAMGFANARAVVFGAHLTSKLKKQAALLHARPGLVVVFDNTCPSPVLSACPTLHVDSRSPDRPFVERETWGTRARMLARWVRVAVRASVYSLRVRHDERAW